MAGTYRDTYRRWREDPERRIDSYIAPKGTLTKRGMANWDGSHEDQYAWFETGVHQTGHLQ